MAEHNSLDEAVVDSVDDCLPAVELRDCVVAFADGGVGPLSLDVGWGSTTAVVGPSGSGKTTLLRVIRGDVAPSSGAVRVAGVDVAALSRRRRRDHRRDMVSELDQDPMLLAELNAIENVELPLLLRGAPASVAAERAAELLGEVGLATRREADISTLSGGERQRVALARALADPAPVVLADEPTASLDRVNADQVAGLLVGLVRSDAQRALVVATHDPLVAGMCERVVDLSSNGGR